MDPVIIKLKPRKDDARFDLLANFESKYKLHQGKSLVDEFPATAEFRMMDDAPNALRLGDFLSVLGYLLVVNERTREFLEAREKGNLEFLPVNLVNHKGRKEKPPYFVVNMLRVVDCVDRVQTVHKTSALNPDRMTRVSNLTLDPAKVPTDTELFRIAGLPPAMIASRALMNDILAANLTGVEIGELKEFRA